MRLFQSNRLFALVSGDRTWSQYEVDLGRVQEAFMTKAEIIDAVYEKVGGFSKKESAEIVEAVFDTMKEVLADGKKIKISGFGNFVVRAKKQRIGRNPQTGAPIPISARRVLTFKPSQVLKGILNPHKGEGHPEKLEENG
jgi:integration host factor subunit alpha